MKRLLGFAALLISGATWGQAAPPIPVPIPGGDVVPPLTTQINLFSPGDPSAFFDGLNAEPNGITNFDGVVAMGYTLGTATDSNGNQYQVVGDVRVFQGDYYGAVPTYPAGGTTSAQKAHGTFVEI